MRAAARPFASLARHPDLALLAVVVLVAAGLRLAFALRVPVFVTKDSLEYIQPALGLVGGGAFELAQRRTPVYPLFIAGSVGLFGQDLLAITFAQHLLGVATAGLAYAIGRLTFGRVAGLLAGLLAALSGPLLIYEHYLITEPVFAFLLVGAVGLFVAGLRTERRALIALGGLTLGLAALTRPVGQAVLVVLPFAFLAHYRAWRPTLQSCALAAGCFALVVVPWAIRNQVVYGTAGAASIGRFLISRSVKHERDFVFYEKDVGAYPGEAAERTRARQIAQEVTNKRPEPGQIFQRVRDELGLTEARTDALLKDIALEAIMRNPGLWVEGTVEMFSELVRGAPKEESVRWHLGVHDQPRVANQWSGAGLAHLLGAPTPAQARELDRAEPLARIFRPTQHTGALVVLFLAGMAAALLRPHPRPALLPALVVLVLLAASAALVGDVPRYRYPIDPLLYAVAAGGLTSLAGLGLAAARRVRADLGARASGPLRHRILRIEGIVSGGGIYGPGRPPGGRAGRPRRQGTEAPGAEVAR
jgi:4-amino-4-deoxy-L-arabinose transferase-like glycosyltransferase